LPTGERRPLGPADGLNTPRRLGDLRLDDLLADPPSAADGPDGLCDRGGVQSAGEMLCVRASSAFRELVVFTPAHRHAFCIEPYTCATDAINLHQRGVGAGLLTL